MIDSQLVGVVACCVGGGEGKLEGASGVLRLDGASDSEGGPSPAAGSQRPNPSRRKQRFGAESAGLST